MGTHLNDFEQMSFDPFSLNTNLTDINDPDQNYFNDETFNNFETKYFFQEDIKETLYETTQFENLSLLHLNIRSLNTNFEDFRNLLQETDFPFNIICLTETWFSDKSFQENSNFHLLNYDAIHLERKTQKRGGGVLIYVKTNLMYKIRNDLSISDCDREILSIEIINNEGKNFIISCCYKPPNGNVKKFNEFLNHIFECANNENKGIFTLGDFNMNCLNYENDTEVRDFYNNVFQNGAIPLINKPTRVTTTTATLIDNIFTNNIFDSSLKKGIIKTSISDHFPVFVAINISKDKIKHKKTEIHQRIFSEQNKRNFSNDLQNINWNLNNVEGANAQYEHFINIFSSLYEKHFPLTVKNIKMKNLMTPWMSLGLRKSSRRKQKLYIKFLKKKTINSENKYKSYKNLFEKLKKKSKQLYYLTLLRKYQYNSKKTWQIMKELTGKLKQNSKNLPRMIKTNEKTIYKENDIAEEFNTFFTNVGPKLAEKIPPTQKSFKDYLTNFDKSIESNELLFEEFEDAFKSLKRNKASGVDDLNSNIIIDAYNDIKVPLFYVFKTSIREGVFPDALKIAKVSPIFKTGDTSLLGNYRPISVLPVFSKILERIMYNRLYNFLIKNNLLFSRQFGFQKNTSTEHAIIQLADDITKSFFKGEFTLGIFIDLSKAFDTVNHSILLNKLDHYGINGKTKTWLESYLRNRHQYIGFGKCKFTKLLKISCGVPQGSILVPLLFLIYVNDLNKASTDLLPIMFADDINIFFI